jgi:hypothetical protein
VRHNRLSLPPPSSSDENNTLPNSHFTKSSHRGVCIFNRRPTSEQGQRGFRLSSLGILLARSVRPRPWRHVAALRTLAYDIYASLEQEAPGCAREPQEDDWEPAQRFFEERRVRHPDLGGAGEWRRWSEELDDENNGVSIRSSLVLCFLTRVTLIFRLFFFGFMDLQQRCNGMDTSIHANPTLHLPHLLRVLGPSSLTLYKHVLGRRRILVYTQPPIEPAGIFCQVAADMCFEDQTALGSPEGSAASRPRLKGKQKDGISVLGVVTLHDIGLLESESMTGRGWIACASFFQGAFVLPTFCFSVGTTDALFLEKPQYYDLVIDMTTFSRPSLQLSVRESNGRSLKPSYRLSTIRFTWSDVKLVSPDP